MTPDRLMRVSERWFRLLLRLYPADFRDEMGLGVLEAYREHARLTLSRSGAIGLAWLWRRALADALWSRAETPRGHRLEP